MANSDRYPTITISSSRERRPRPAPRSDECTAFGRGFRIKGQITAAEQVIIEGEFEGEIAIPDHGLAIGGAAQVRGDVYAQTITVLGHVEGNLTATALIELRPSAVVTGRLASPRLSIEEGAWFRGRVDSTKTDAVVAVARHRLRPAPVTATGRAVT